MKKFLKIFGTIILLLIIGLTIFYYVNNEGLPEGKSNKEADVLANKMLKALNYETYKNTRFLEWSFRGKHFYKWDKQKNIVEISWDKNKVILHTKNQANSSVFIDNKQVDAPKTLKKAIDYFNNDSFWLVAPYKVFEAGIERKIVQHENKDALMITYTTGGSTPGDSYLWILDDNYKPIAYKMWVSIIPTGGMEASWNDWTTTQSGAILPTKHELSIGTLYMGDVKGYN
ncbi:MULTISPECIES: hypothetical protein [unclassified Tenacibaculum]|uniref:hypothetical protein n=1 Tax=unclassified Tenacibaculum TaxID=2635139 RepID=UPI001F16BD6B|nr:MULTISPECIES: hypothetical protein [unclassified Tenacibaculum]MCF2873852.1 hypothetical protein [Tenacibaculum sp. Cn5-1]MCF2936662.1 hypothetical protein [Tenacibaculum sp. Cn5-34]MCG7512886.1 hypothetical protein [Tenacibaculum sp. Cn5-46]